MPSPLVALLQAPDRQALDALLAEAVLFHSPVADYEGRADVAHLLSLITTVLRDLQASRELVDGAASTTYITATVDARPVQGVLDEHYDGAGRLIDVTLMLRPFATVRVAIAAMAAGLASDPLPSAR